METVGQSAALPAPRPGGAPRPTIVRGQGVWLWDADGRRCLDGIGSIHVVSIGHGVAEVGEAMARQAARIAYAFNAHFTTEPQERLAEQVVAMAPAGTSRAYFVSGGSEATARRSTSAP